MGAKSAGQLSKEQHSRMIIKLQEDLEAKTNENQARAVEIAQLGVQVSPMTFLQAQINTLIDHVAPNQYAKLRFDLAVQMKMADAMSEENITGAMDDIRQQQMEMQKQMAMAEQGRTESGLFVPETKEVAEVTAIRPPEQQA